MNTPYVLAYVDLPDDKLRIMTRLEGLEPDEVEIGLPVRLVSRPDERDSEGGTVMFAFEHEEAQS